jgi:hypothetical protein
MYIQAVLSFLVFFAGFYFIFYIWLSVPVFHLSSLYESLYSFRCKALCLYLLLFLFFLCKRTIIVVHTYMYCVMYIHIYIHTHTYIYIYIHIYIGTLLLLTNS